jgi:hypothetical protein
MDRTSYNKLDGDSQILMIGSKSVAYVPRWIAKKCSGGERYVSEDDDIAIEEENKRPPVMLQRRPESRYFPPKCQCIVVVQYYWGKILAANGFNTIRRLTGARKP